jgi:cytochrome c-type biogenesis protein CcmH/NrfG
VPRVRHFLIALLVLAHGLQAADPRVEALIARGDAEDRQQHTQAALALYQQAEQLDPDNVPLLLKISRMYSDLVKQTETREPAQRSLDYARRALALDPKNAKAHLSVAVGYGKLTDFVGNKTKLEYSRILKEETEKALALDPSDAFGWYLLGRWHFGVANVNGILRVLAKVVYGGLPPASNDEAARCLRKAVELAPHEPAHHSALARVYTAQGKLEEARKHWLIVLASKPTDAEEIADQKEARKALGK